MLYIAYIHMLLILNYWEDSQKQLQVDHLLVSPVRGPVKLPYFTDQCFKAVGRPGVTSAPATDLFLVPFQPNGKSSGAELKLCWNLFVWDVLQIQAARSDSERLSDFCSRTIQVAVQTLRICLILNICLSLEYILVLLGKLVHVIFNYNVYHNVLVGM